MPKLIRDFEILVQLHSAAQVAVWLGYRDTRPIFQWIQRRRIPAARKALVQRIVAERLHALPHIRIKPEIQS